jgi:hypothetical protein
VIWWNAEDVYPSFGLEDELLDIPRLYEDEPKKIPLMVEDELCTLEVLA